MHPHHFTDYEFAVEKSLHGSDAERRLAEAFLFLFEQQQHNAQDCPFCGCPSS
jgi:hypothetical protein